MEVKDSLSADETSKTITVTNTGTVPLAYAIALAYDIGYNGQETPLRDRHIEPGRAFSGPGRAGRGFKRRAVRRVKTDLSLCDKSVFEGIGNRG